jgi:hypothetical protein
VEGNERSLKLPRQPRFTRDGLTVVLVFASMIVAGLSMVQGRTIDSQRNVIHLLFLDSQELNAIKVHDQQQKHSAAANAQSDQQQKADARNNCADSKDKSGKGCAVPQATTPGQPTQEKNRTPEKSGDDNSMPNPQRLLHSI